MSLTATVKPLAEHAVKLREPRSGLVIQGNTAMIQFSDQYPVLNRKLLTQANEQSLSWPTSKGFEDEPLKKQQLLELFGLVEARFHQFSSEELAIGKK